MAKQSRNYKITDTEIRDNGSEHSRIIHPRTFIEASIPEDAKLCHKPVTGEPYYTFNVEVDGGVSILVQAYDVEPGEEAVFELFVREKKIAAGYLFIYCRLYRTNQSANAQAQIHTGAYLRSLHKWRDIDSCTLIECPQEKHFGAIIIAPLHIDLPEDEEALVAQAKSKSKKWTNIRRRRKARAS